MEQAITIQNILAQREEFLVIGLTGRMGSGCSKVAEVLATPYDKMNFPSPSPQQGQESLTEEGRILRILAEYADSHWLKFDVIRVGAIIATFILNDDRMFIFDLSNQEKAEDVEIPRAEFRKTLLKDCYVNTVELGMKHHLLEEKKINARIPKEVEEHSRARFVQIEDGLYFEWIKTDAYTARLRAELEKLGRKFEELVSDDKTIHGYFDREDPHSFDKILDKEEMWNRVRVNMNDLFRQGLDRNLMVNRRKYLECVDELLTLLSFHCLMQMLDDCLKEGGKAADTLWGRLAAINRCIEPNAKETDGILQIHKFVFTKYITTWFGSTVRSFVTNRLGDDAYARLFQRYGQMIRCYGRMPSCEKDTPAAAQGDEKRDIFAIPRKINQHIKVLRHPFHSKEHRPVRIVVDSIKNVFEAVYLRYRYSAFYLWAITTDGSIRERRLHDKHLTDIQIRKLEWNEYPDRGSAVIRELDGLLGEEKAGADTTRWKDIYTRITEDLKDGTAKADFYLDCMVSKQNIPSNPETTDERSRYENEISKFNCMRLNFFRDGSYVFYTQDVDGCVCNADVYLFNNARDTTDTENNVKLLQAVVRNVSLIMYPGLVRPTSVERCMQIAFSAKVNSGCLSRQVGAVVTDSQYNILAIGWNDVPCGEVSCAYKNLNDIAAHADQDAYSEYELHSPDFRARLANNMDFEKKKVLGLPMSYCFKDIHKEERDPMRSRAMHAEEKALALCGREAEGGYLFTTSSPCEMCSKNAKNHRIKKIYYLEAYPGISQAQYTNSGDANNRAELILFSGAVGRAYMQMYTPLLPHKDVLKYLRNR